MHSAAASLSAEAADAAAGACNNLELLNGLVNHERQGLPAASGTSASAHFDLSRMARLLAALGDPQEQLRAVHVAGSKGEASSTRAWVSGGGMEGGCG